MRHKITALTLLSALVLTPVLAKADNAVTPPAPPPGMSMEGPSGAPPPTAAMPAPGSVLVPTPDAGASMEMSGSGKEPAANPPPLLPPGASGSSAKEMATNPPPLSPPGAPGASAKEMSMSPPPLLPPGAPGTSAKKSGVTPSSADGGDSSPGAMDSQ